MGATISPARLEGYDALVVVGFGGPEKREDVIPFLENVLRGRNVPRERMLEVAEHYDHLGGASPINNQVRALIAALEEELRRHDLVLPVYWGNRNWHPMLVDAVRGMTDAGVKRALALVLAGFSSYSSCRQYREDIERAREAVGPGAPVVDKIRVFHNHPGFVEANADLVRDALGRIPAELRGGVHLTFTAHSIPVSMAGNCDYERQLSETCRLVAEAVGVEPGPDRWKLVYQSRSGRPADPWLEPDILAHLDNLKSKRVTDVLIHPIGFLSDHVEVLYDLDEEASRRSRELGLRMVRSATVGTHPRFVGMLRELIEERIGGTLERLAVGCFEAGHDSCPAECCLPPTPARQR
jgi:ferrochelatase